MYNFIERRQPKGSQRIDPPEMYGKVMDAIGITCHDLMIVYKGFCLVGERTQEPAKGAWWSFGGRVRTFMPTRQFLQELLSREMKWTTHKLTRFQDLNLSIRFLWNKREQEPVDNGCDMTGHYFYINVDLEEKRKIDALLKHTEQDFHRLRWVPLRFVVRGGDEEMQFHYGMRIFAMHIMKHRSWVYKIARFLDRLYERLFFPPIIPPQDEVRAS